MFHIEKASRKAAKIKLALAGVSGSGKTFSSLQLAKGIVGDLAKVCVLDTENRSSDLYASEGSFAVVDFKPPYSPEKYIEAMNFIESSGFELVIIDSISPEWDGEGGCLEMHDKAGGRFQDWAKITPLHRKLFDSIRRSSMHVICTLRKKTDYAMDQSTGKPRAIKVGLKDVQRDGIDYEFDVVLDIDHSHYASASKDRTNLFANKPPFVITPETGKALIEWANSGEQNVEPARTVGDLFSSQEPEHRNLLRRVVEELGLGNKLDIDRRKALVQYLASQNVRADKDSLKLALKDYLRNAS